MHKPELIYAKNPEFPEEVAWTVAFAPTFETRLKTKTYIETVENKVPVPARHTPDELQFIFLVERSDTMKG